MAIQGELWIETTPRKRRGVISTLLTLLILGVVIAVIWTALRWIVLGAVGLIALGVKIAIVLAVVVALLAFFGWFRARVLKR